MGAEMQARIDVAVVEWAKQIPLNQVPAVLAFLSARLLAEGYADQGGEPNGASATESEKLFTAGELAERLNLPESWIRCEERAGRIPGIRAGKYVRFKLSDVELALAERQREGLNR
jgi:excisionase family DNA binding protein